MIALSLQCYHDGMRQLITRIDDRLHERLKDRAAAEGRSLNDLVTELLQEGIADGDERTLLRWRADKSGLRVVPVVRGPVPSRAKAIASTKGAGRAASQALSRERRAR